VQGIKSDNKRCEWALNAYKEFIDIKNEELENESPKSFKELKEFPLSTNTLIELIKFWTPFYAVNTIRNLINV
jgi:hypothetical protein